MQYMLSNSDKFIAKDKGENQHQTPILDCVSLHYTTPGFKPGWNAHYVYPPRDGTSLTISHAVYWQFKFSQSDHFQLAI